MKKLCVTFVLIFSFTCLLAGQDLKREFKMEYGKTVEVNLTTGGSIEIKGWDKPLVQVQARSHGGSIDDYKFDFDETPSGVKINVSDYEGRGDSDIDLKVSVPGKCNLELETMGGDMTVDNVEGSIEGKTMGGDLELSNLKGKVELTTMGGDIRLEDSELDGELKSMGGEITFERVLGSVKGSTMGGDVTYRGVKKDGSVKKELSISTMGGEISVDYAPGGANVSTMGGDIEIRYAGVFVKAKTMGGDIKVGQLDGGIKASTMGGDLEVNMIGDPKQGDRSVDLSSKGGNIILTLPENLSIDFNVKLTYTKREDRKYEVRSDFPIKIEQSEDWDYSHGSARKYITGTGKIGDGKNSVRLETTNGDITIRKGL